MSIEKTYLTIFGPIAATFGYTVGSENKYKVNDLINGMTVVAKLEDGDMVCTDRSSNMCPTCVASGWAEKLKCEIPMVKQQS